MKWLTRPEPPEGMTELARARLIVWFFYVFALTRVFNSLDFAIQAAGTKVWEPQLGIGIVSWLDRDTFVPVLVVASLLFTFGALFAVIAPGIRAARIAFFVGHLIHLAIAFDLQGKIDHGHHIFLWTAFVFIFLPPFKLAETDVAARRAFQTVLWTAAALALMTYTFAGLSKVAVAVVALFEGKESWLTPDALAHVVAMGPTSVGEGLIRSHPVLVYPLQLGVLYVESFALVAAFKPRLMRPWAIGLVLLHLGIKLAMDIGFSAAVLPLLLLVYASPLAVNGDLRSTLRDLPILGFIGAGVAKVWRRLRSRDAVTPP